MIRDLTATRTPKKVIRLMSTKQQLCTCITLFCTFLCRPWTTTTWKDQILSLLENGNGKEINSTISVWTRARSPLFSSNVDSLLLINRATWDYRQIVWKNMKSSLFFEKLDRNFSEAEKGLHNLFLTLHDIYQVVSLVSSLWLPVLTFSKLSPSTIFCAW